MSPADLACVVLAGGRGTRLAGLHPDVPKPLVAVAGRPFIEWVLLWLRRQGLRSVRLSIGHLAGLLEERLGDGARLGLTLDYRREETPLGTGGALLLALEDLGARPVLVLNADSLVFFDLERLVRRHTEAGAGATLVAVGVPDASRFGALTVGDGGRVLRFAEKGEAGPGLINAGVYLLSAGALADLGLRGPCSLERDVFPRLIDTSAGVHVLATDDSAFVDMGTPAGLAAAEALVRDNLGRLEGGQA